MKIVKLIICLALYNFVSCNYSSSFSDKPNTSKNLIDSINSDSIIKKWINDTNGCKHIRDFKLAESIFNKYKLKDKPYDIFEKIYGYPLKIKKDSTYTILFYTCKSICFDSTKNICLDSCDKQWVMLYISRTGKDNFIDGKIE